MVDAPLFEEVEKIVVAPIQKLRREPCGIGASAKDGQNGLFASFLLEGFPQRVTDRIWDREIDVQMSHCRSAPW
jgi:hypothetical protein